MSEQPFHLPDEPSEVSVSMLIHSLRADSATRGVSPKNYAHRSRVIPQQSELLALNLAEMRIRRARRWPSDCERRLVPRITAKKGDRGNAHLSATRASRRRSRIPMGNNPALTSTSDSGSDLS